MSLDECLHSLDKQLDVHILRELCYDRSIVYGGLGLFHAIDIDTHLCIRQRDITHVSMLYLCSLLLSGAPTHQHLQYLVLDALYASCFCQNLRIQRNAEALVDLYGELDGHDRRQTHIAQHGGHTKVLGIDNLSNDAVYLLLQDIQRGLIAELL